jgi:hypothetical protein
MTAAVLFAWLDDTIGEKRARIEACSAAVAFSYGLSDACAGIVRVIRDGPRPITKQIMIMLR